MKISIAQNEIELAVQNYIRSMVSLAAGTSITIDFSATRGPEGLTANINITQEPLPPAETVDEPVPAQATTAKPVEQAAKTKRLVVADKPKEEPKEAATVVEEKAPQTASAEPEAEVATTVQADASEAAQQGGKGFPGFASEQDQEEAKPPFNEEEKEEVVDAEPAKVEEAAVPIRKSLFGGLARPSNS